MRPYPAGAGRISLKAVATKEGSTMRNYRIVVGVDGSEGGVRALDWAVAEAARRGGTVMAVTAWQWTEPQLGVDLRVEHEKVAREALAAAVDTARTPYPQVVVETEAVAGGAADALVRAATGADLLVLGSHGHSRLFHAVLGSVAEACIRQAACPVVVIPVPRTAAQPAAEPATPISTAVY
jgi:nucleotide-binding universal stress UspA family protein